MRKLASIQEIIELKPHLNADSLEIARILGWDVVVSKNDHYSVGDKVIYFEIDSFLPIRKEFEFLRKSSYRNSPILGEGFRLRTIRLRGQISQGLIMPLRTFFGADEVGNMSVGTDVSERLGVKKWEEPERAFVSGEAKGSRPSFIKRTDETRVQNVPDILEEFYVLKNDIYITVKIDGSSHSIGINESDEFFVTSHSMDLKETDKQGSFWAFVKEHKLEEKLRIVKKSKGLTSIVVQGEWAGPGIQKNKLGLLKPEWFVFTVDENLNRVSLEESIQVVENLGLKFVPILCVISSEVFKEQFPNYEQLLEYAKGNPSEVYKKEQEGIVIRPTVPVYSEILGTDLSIKVVNNDYLLKED